MQGAVSRAAMRVQVVGRGWFNYWKNPWNKFDCVLCVMSLVDMIVALSATQGVAGLSVSGCSAGARLGVGWQWGTEWGCVAAWAMAWLHGQHTSVVPQESSWFDRHQRRCHDGGCLNDAMG